MSFNRKLGLAIVIFLLCVSICMTGFAEPFTQRGISFGMTRDDIKAVEDLRLDDSCTATDFIRYKGTIAQINDSSVEYHFDSDGKLEYISIAFGVENNAFLNLTNDYRKIENALIQKYGDPLDNTEGKPFRLVGHALSMFFDLSPMLQTSASLLGLKYEFNYKEWTVPTDGGLVKIDHYYYCLHSNPIELGHTVEYTFFADEDALNIGDDL